MDKNRITISSRNFISCLTIALIVLKLCGVITMPCILAIFFLLFILLLCLNIFKKAFENDKKECQCTNSMVYNTDRVSFTSNIFKEKEIKNETSRKSRSTKRKSKESDSIDKGEESSK